VVTSLPGQKSRRIARCRSINQIRFAFSSPGEIRPRTTRQHPSPENWRNALQQQNHKTRRARDQDFFFGHENIALFGPLGLRSGQQGYIIEVPDYARIACSYEIGCSTVGPPNALFLISQSPPRDLIYTKPEFGGTK